MLCLTHSGNKCRTGNSLGHLMPLLGFSHHTTPFFMCITWAALCAPKCYTITQVQGRQTSPPGTSYPSSRYNFTLFCFSVSILVHLSFVLAYLVSSLLYYVTLSQSRRILILYSSEDIHVWVLCLLGYCMPYMYYVN